MTLAGSAPSTDGHLDLHREGYVGSNVGTSHPESYENKTRHRNLNNAALPSRNQGFLYGVRPTPRRKAQAQFHTDFYTPQHLPFHASRHHGGGGFNSLRGLVKPSVEKVPGLKLEKQNVLHAPHESGNRGVGELNRDPVVRSQVQELRSAIESLRGNDHQELIAARSAGPPEPKFCEAIPNAFIPDANYLPRIRARWLNAAIGSEEESDAQQELVEGVRVFTRVIQAYLVDRARFGGHKRPASRVEIGLLQREEMRKAREVQEHLVDTLRWNVSPI
ncbi:hypothetical protein MMC12_002485 [Toensbergia leucococca]|nr:hypothetical protein [Toensbergia leucococca]